VVSVCKFSVVLPINQLPDLVSVGRHWPMACRRRVGSQPIERTGLEVVHSEATRAGVAGRQDVLAGAARGPVLRWRAGSASKASKSFA
jgi:hypothetical protein